MKNVTTWLSIISICILWSACYERVDNPADIVEKVWFPVQAEASDAQMEALLTGLLVEQGGCLYIRSEDDQIRYVPVWPFGYDYRLHTDSTYLILNSEGNEVARSGVGIRVSGGEIRDRQLLRIKDTPVDMQGRCPGPYWLVGNEVSVHELGMELPASAAAGLSSWLAYYDDYVTDWRLSAFELTDKWTIDEILTVESEDIYDLRLRPASWLITSPDERFNLDLYAYETVIENQGTERERVYAQSPDSEVAIENRYTGQRRRVLFCGTPCAFEAGYWVDNNTIMIAGRSQGQDGQYHPALWWVHLPSRELRFYRYPTPLVPPYPESYISRVVFGE